MSAEINTILWMLLVVGLLLSLAAAKFTARTRVRVQDLYGPAGVAFLSITGLATVALWVWLALLTGYWQLGALSVGGFLIGLAASDGGDL